MNNEGKNLSRRNRLIILHMPSTYRCISIYAIEVLYVLQLPLYHLESQYPTLLMSS